MTGVSKSAERRGSRTSDKQISQTVKDGKGVVGVLPTGKEVFGYVCGSDDFHWVVVTPTVEVVLLHKSIPALKITRRSLADEPHSREIQALVAPYRAFIMRFYYRKQERSNDAEVLRAIKQYGAQAPASPDSPSAGDRPRDGGDAGDILDLGVGVSLPPHQDRASVGVERSA